MKTGDRVIRSSSFGVALKDGPIRPTRTRAVARQIVKMYALFGKRARVIEGIRSNGFVAR